MEPGDQLELLVLAYRLLGHDERATRAALACPEFRSARLRVLRRLVAARYDADDVLGRDDDPAWRREVRALACALIALEQERGG